jgi:cell division protein FtsB
VKTSAAMSFFTPVKEKISQWKQHPVGKVLLNKYFIVGFIFLVYICFLDTNNVGQMIRSRITLRNQRQQMEFYEREITKMDRKLEQLQSERDSLEKFAREEYFYHKDGEDVYVIK